MSRSMGKAPLGFGFGRFVYPGGRRGDREEWALEWNSFGVRLGVAVECKPGRFKKRWLSQSHSGNTASIMRRGTPPITIENR